ncbi:RNA chaperone ProQ [Aeromonas schubertii]|uniref:RNA chaperone ProQ n=1 Tax=Aeromonas schubertii TaxID=652 RepID=A0A0S2SLV7_9GAMM|nr:RNA chaperone ProQ [Aeromonas schubertii]ALP42612.1 ProP expression regulator [Aeromonas schubertii]KUE79725.1 RNA chaperone ProQ [Aeromonas schubertii]MBZ6068325.1 RNA chaperone ProQ [Aeromonas schubertii]MBZ6073518.1 RNA chaperone ProQ [Aeromonas schubertii]QCG48332.1 RNA chaperone ProQ [Aeromonas schubertii]
MENTEKLKNSKEVIAYLIEKFPACFIAEGEAKPLKIGIFQDLAARLADDPKVSKTLLRSALRQYTSSWRYLHGLKAGIARVDLDGNPGELLTEEHVEHAKQALKESKDRVFASRRVTNKSDKPKKPRRPQPRKVSADELKLEQGVKVVLGKSPVAATIKEITKDDVQVQLQTGMMMRVKFEHLVL